MIDKDIVTQTLPFFRMKYARLLNYSHYQESFTGGNFDSRSTSSDAYVSKALNAGGREYSLKYYPSRSHSIGLIRTGYAHFTEAYMEAIDGKFRDWFGKPDNSFFMMHEWNADEYLRFRKK